MSEKINLSQIQKDQSNYMQTTFGVEYDGPLSPEFVKGMYDTAVKHRVGLGKTAEMYESIIANHDSPSTKGYITQQAADIRSEGEEHLRATTQGVKSYVANSEVISSYIEDARHDMASDFTSREEQKVIK